MAEAMPPRQSQGFLKYIVALGTALFLASCGEAPRHVPVVPPPPPPVVKATPQTGLPDDANRHRVALLVPLSGANAAVGQSIADAAALALVDTGGKDLRITNYDTNQGAAAAAQKAIADGNALFLGPLLAEDVRAVTGPAAAAGIPVISFSNDASVVGDNVWLLGFSPSQSIERVVRYARSRGAARFAGLIPPGTYGHNVANTLIHSADASGGRVVAMQSYSRAPKSVTTAVAALAKQKYDAVLIADAGRSAVSLVPLLRKNGGADARILGPELWNAEPGLNNAPAMSGAWFASVDNTLFSQLSTRYRARYGRTPYRLSSLGYDAVLLTTRIARDWKMGSPFPTKALADEGGFVGVDGAFRFGDEHIAERALAVHQLGTKGSVVVSPAPKEF